MADSARQLLRYNTIGFLIDILAMEDHAEDLDEKQISHSWCIVKHGVRAYGHHLKEFINHCQRDDECREKVLTNMEKFRKEFFSEVIEPLTDENTEEPPGSDLLHMLSQKRNEFREIIKPLFPKLAKIDPGCPICELDVSFAKSELRAAMAEV